MTPPELDVNDELAHAAADLEAVNARLDETVDTVERLEAVLDAVLDHPHLQVCVVGEDLRIAAVSRGLADRWPGAQQPPLGQRLDEVAPESWGDLSALIGAATEDRWIEVPTDAGVLSARRASIPAGDNRGSSAGGQIVLRFVEE
jgi:hypothetical protein